MTPSRFRHALRGVRDAVSRDPSIWLHLWLAVLVLLAAVVACLSLHAWALLVLSIGGVLAAELLNSALEQLADEMHPRRREGIRRAKDIAAASVLVAAFAAAAVGALLFLPLLVRGTAGACWTG